MFKIDLTESFPLLAHAPIVEAVIGVTARAESDWEEAVITDQFKQRLLEYGDFQAQRHMQFEFRQDLNSAPQQAIHDLGFSGFRTESADKLHVAQFNRDGFSFSRLSPYQSWQNFYQEGFRLWDIYKEVAKPSVIQRIGLRFINRIEFPHNEPITSYLENPPKPPRGMEGIPINGFLHHNTFEIDGYSINLTQTVQPPQAQIFGGLILDIDVFTTTPVDDQNSLAQHLTNMRWLKNKVFFGSVTSKTQEMIK